MPPQAGDALVMLTMIAVGCGIFLRIVAKEKHRRERYLMWRLEEKTRELEQAQQDKPAEQESETAAAAPGETSEAEPNQADQPT